jgi:hypothetical protein
MNIVWVWVHIIALLAFVSVVIMDDAQWTRIMNRNKNTGAGIKIQDQE